MRYINFPYTDTKILEILQQSTQILIDCDIDSIIEYVLDPSQNKFKN